MREIEMDAILKFRKRQFKFFGHIEEKGLGDFGTHRTY